MAVLKIDETPATPVKPGLERRLIHGNKLMTAVLDFSGGPWEEPEPLHMHPHEQTSYIASGEVEFFCEGEAPQHLKQGDVFYAPSGKKHGVRLLTETARLVDNFTPVREDFLQTARKDQ
jgi:quercetin dioxygenase-like cupin family protein